MLVKMRRPFGWFETGEAVVDRFSCRAEIFVWDSARWQDGVNDVGQLGKMREIFLLFISASSKLT